MCTLFLILFNLHLTHHRISFRRVTWPRGSAAHEGGTERLEGSSSTKHRHCSVAESSIKEPYKWDRLGSGSVHVCVRSKLDIKLSMLGEETTASDKSQRWMLCERCPECWCFHDVSRSGVVLHRLTLWRLLLWHDCPRSVFGSIPSHRSTATCVTPVLFN